jgi:UDPglucose 6-dehydrogenase
LLVEMIERGTITFTTDPQKAYDGAEAILIAVGTPTTPQGHPDLSQLESAVDAIAATARTCAVIVRSTVPVGTGDRLQAEALSRFVVIANPEFLREGHAIEDSLRPDRIVGGGNDNARDLLAALYRRVIDQSFAPVGALLPAENAVPFFWMDRRSAELAKYAANAFLATRLSFVNEIANVAAQVGADIRAITRVIGADPRIGPAFLRPGIGWGGSCFPKDARALAEFALDSGYDFMLLRAVIGQNNQQVARSAALIREALGARSDTRIGLLGLAFKSGTADVRESPAIALANLLLAEGWAVRAFDPRVATGTAGVPEGIEIVSSIEAAASGADALVIATEWPEFATADFAALARTMRGDLVFDGRCIADPARVTVAGLRYLGICPPPRSAAS